MIDFCIHFSSRLKYPQARERQTFLVAESIIPIFMLSRLMLAKRQFLDEARATCAAHYIA